MDYRLRQDAEQKLRAEVGTIYKPAAHTTSVALVYPNTYFVGMSNLGFQTIYGYLNAREDVCCERAFLPEPENFSLYSQTHTALFSLESQSPLSEFDLVAFSVSFENDYLNLLTILELSGIPLQTEERTDADPCILVGGAITTINPEPLALFVDLFVIGDGEIVLDALLDAYRQSGGKHAKQPFLERAAALPGVYVPAYYQVSYNEHGLIAQIDARPPAPQTITQAVLPELSHYPAYSRILTEQTEFGGLFLLQLNRGCPYRCRFCHTGYTQPTLRHLPLHIALQLIQQGVQHRNRIGLVGAAVTEYPYLREVCQAIREAGATISIASLRISALLNNDALLQALLDAGQKSVALAPEAGTERLRKLVRKALPDRLLYEAVEFLAGTPVNHLKFYFLVGLPTETQEDLEAIVNFCKKSLHLFRKTGKDKGTFGKITLSINPFVPKPFTPFQWSAMATEAELKRKLQAIQRGVSRFRNVEVIYEAPKWAVWQGILARGDRRVGHVLALMLQYQGDWKKAFRELHLHPEFYAHRSRNPDEILPWSHLAIGEAQHGLFEEYQRVIAGEQGTV